MRRLANKEQELQDYVSQIAEYKSGQAPGPAALRSALLDPAVNILFEKLKHELQSTRAKLEETQNELSAWKFTPDSNTGKRLMAKCRLLYQENEELGKMTSNGRLAKLEGELAMQKSFSEEVKKSQSELDDFLQELDEDVEGMQSTILFLQQELKSAKDKIQQLEKENFQNKIDSTNEDTNNSINLINGNKISSINVLNDEIGISSECYDNNVITKFNSNYLLSSNNNCLINNNKNNINNSNLIVDNNLRTNINIKTSNTIYNGNDLVSTIATTTTKIIDINGNNDNNENHHRNENLTNNNNPIDCTISSNNNLKNDINKTAVCNLRKRNFEDSDSSENSSSTNNDCTLRSSKKIKKKTRRSSFLRLDLDEEDTQIADESDDDVVPNVGTRRKSIRNHQNGEHN